MTQINLQELCHVIKANDEKSPTVPISLCNVSEMTELQRTSQWLPGLLEKDRTRAAGGHGYNRAVEGSQYHHLEVRLLMNSRLA